MCATHAIQEQIRGLITALMLNAPPPVRAQLSEALTIISGHDFPARWKSLLPELCERLGSDDAAVVNGVLETANSIFKRCFLHPLIVQHPQQIDVLAHARKLVPSLRARGWSSP